MERHLNVSVPCHCFLPHPCHTVGVEFGDPGCSCLYLRGNFIEMFVQRCKPEVKTVYLAIMLDSAYDPDCREDHKCIELTSYHCQTKLQIINYCWILCRGQQAPKARAPLKEFKVTGISCPLKTCELPPTCFWSCLQPIALCHPVFC